VKKLDDVATGILLKPTLKIHKGRLQLPHVPSEILPCSMRGSFAAYFQSFNRENTINENEKHTKKASQKENQPLKNTRHSVISRAVPWSSSYCTLPIFSKPFLQ
jgi:hypothetical protein